MFTYKQSKDEHREERCRRFHRFSDSTGLLYCLHCRLTGLSGKNTRRIEWNSRRKIASFHPTYVVPFRQNATVAVAWYYFLIQNHLLLHKESEFYSKFFFRFFLSYFETIIVDECENRNEKKKEKLWSIIK